MTRSVGPSPSDHTLARPVCVIAVTYESTRSALAVAVPLARHRGVPLAVAVWRMGHDGAELQLSSQETACLASRYEELVRGYGSEADIEVNLTPSVSPVQPHLPEGATIVVAGCVGQGLDTAEETLAKQLSGDGRQVVFVAHVDGCAPLVR